MEPETGMGDEPIPYVAVQLTRLNHRFLLGVCTFQRSHQTIDENFDNKPVYTMQFYDFEDNEQLSNLDALLTRLGGIVLYLAEDADDKRDALIGRKLHNVLQGKDVERVHIKRSLFLRPQKEIHDHLDRLVAPKDRNMVDTIEFERRLAFGCAGCLIQSLRLRDDEEYAQRIRIHVGAIDTFMRIDSAAADAVNLLPKPDHPSQFGSIFGVLNRCCTKLGSRLLERWLRQPLLDHREIDRRLDIVEAFKEQSLYRNMLRDGPLRRIPDLLSIIAKMQRKNAGLNEMYGLYLFTASIPHITNALEDLTASLPDSDSTAADDHGQADGDGDEAVTTQPILSRDLSVQAARKEASRECGGAKKVIRQRFLLPLQVIAGKFTMYERLIRHVVDFDALERNASSGSGGELRVNAAHDPELQQLAQEQQELEERAEEIYLQARQRWSAHAVDVKLEMNSAQNGFSLRTTRGEDERKLREYGKKEGNGDGGRGTVEILSILKNGVHFTVPDLRRVADRHMECTEQYAVIQQALVQKALATALTYIPVVEAVAELIAELDVLVGFATAAALAPGDYVRPKILPLGSGRIHLKEARHPCVELMDGMQFIGNDYEMVRGESGFQIVTGPNMGGKSTFIRGIGAIVVMAQVGMFVPCSAGVPRGADRDGDEDGGPEISVVDCVLARVGAGDAVQKGVSTFMAEMLESAVILQTATRNSLLIIDELGRGTSTFDGFGLAYAISHYILSHVDCLCLFATHFHELTALAAATTTSPTSVALVSDASETVTNDEAGIGDGMGEEKSAEGDAASVTGMGITRRLGAVNKHVEARIDQGKVVMMYRVRHGPCTRSYGIHVARTAGFPAHVIASAKRKAAALERAPLTARARPHGQQLSPASSAAVDTTGRDADGDEEEGRVGAGGMDETGSESKWKKVCSSLDAFAAMTEGEFYATEASALLSAPSVPPTVHAPAPAAAGDRVLSAGEATTPDQEQVLKSITLRSKLKALFPLSAL